MPQRSVAELERERERLYAELAATGDFRRGSVNETFRRCGKAGCACAGAGHPGHGPRYLWTRSAGGRTQTQQVSAAELAKVRREVERYRRFTRLSEQIVEVNEAICQARPVTPVGDRTGPESAAGQKRGSGRRSNPTSSPR